MSGRQRSDGQRHLAVAVTAVLLVMLLDGLFVYLAASRAWSQIQANRGIHGTFAPASCRTETFTYEQPASRYAPGGERTSYRFACEGTFTPDGGRPGLQAAYTTATPPILGRTMRAVIASRRSPIIYAEGGSPAGYVVLTVVLLVPPIFLLGTLAAARRRGRPTLDPPGTPEPDA